MLRLRATAKIALTALLVVVVALGILGSTRFASACMRLSLVEAPCCAAMRAHLRLQGEDSCCHGGRLEAARAADTEASRTEVPLASWVTQPAWPTEQLLGSGDQPQRGVTLDRARPPPLAPHLAFTLLRC